MTDDQGDPRIKALREVMKKRITELGLSVRGISRQIGNDASFLQDFLGPMKPTKNSKGPKKHSINIESMMKIEKILRFERGELSNFLEPDDVHSASVPTPIKRKFPLNSSTGLPASRKIPLYAMVNLRTGGVRMSQAAEFETPIGLETNDNTFVVVMPDATMRPAFDVGHKLIVQPDAPISASEFVFIEVAGDDNQTEGFVRRLIGRSEEGIKTETLTPAEEVIIPHGDIVSIAPVIAALFRK